MAEIIVMHARPFDPTKTATMAVPHAVGGTMEDSPFEQTFYGGETDVYACWGAPGYVTGSADTPASTHIPGVIVEPFAYEISLFGDPAMSSPGSAAGSGSIVLVDPKGDLDDWLSYGWDGRAITLYRGDSGAALSTFSVVARLTCDGWGEIGRGRKTLLLRDLAWQLATPVPVPTFAGTGGAEGGSELTGATKPWTLGSCVSIQPLLINSTLLIFQWHDPVLNVTSPFLATLRVGGVSWGTSGDFPTYEQLAAAVIPAGEYATCNALGMFRLGSAVPEGQNIRVVALGLDGTLGAGPEHVIERLIERMGPIMARGGTVLASDIDMGSIVTSGSGIHFPSGAASPTVRELLDALTYPTGFYWWPSLTGTIFVRALVDPDGETATVTIDAALPFTIVSEPRITVLMPRRQTVIRAARNEQPSARGELAGSLTEDEILAYTRTYAEAVGDDSVNAGVAHPSARVVVSQSAWRSRTNAIVRAQALTEIFRRQRYLVQMRVAGIDPLDPPLGQVVELLNFDRFGWGAAKNFLCIGARASVRRGSLELTLFG